MKRTTVYLTDEQEKALKREAFRLSTEEKSVSVSEVIREILDTWVKTKEKE